MTPKYYEYLHSGYVPIMWPYRHVFRAMPRRRALRHAGRRAIPLAHGPRIVRYTRSRDRKHRRGCICTPDILIHSTIHTDYIIGLCRVDRPSNWPSYPTSLDPIEITRMILTRMIPAFKSNFRSIDRKWRDSTTEKGFSDLLIRKFVSSTFLRLSIWTARTGSGWIRFRN